MMMFRRHRHLLMMRLGEEINHIIIIINTIFYIIEFVF